MGVGTLQPGHVILLVMYFLPTVVSALRRTGITGRTFVLDLLFGWTGVV